jgi:hypothetical protein
MTGQILLNDSRQDQQLLDGYLIFKILKLELFPEKIIVYFFILKLSLFFLINQSKRNKFCGEKLKYCLIYRSNLVY